MAGNVEFTVSSEDEFEPIKEFVEMAYNKLAAGPIERRQQAELVWGRSAFACRKRLTGQDKGLCFCHIQIVVDIKFNIRDGRCAAQFDIGHRWCG